MHERIAQYANIKNARDSSTCLWQQIENNIVIHFCSDNFDPTEETPSGTGTRMFGMPQKINNNLSLP